MANNDSSASGSDKPRDSAIQPAEQGKSEYVQVDLRSFVAGRPPLVDIYYHVAGQYVLYCEAGADFTDTARLRLLSNGITDPYIRFTNGHVGAGNLNLPDLLAIPDSRLPPLIKAGLLYSSTLAIARNLYTSPVLPENLAAAQQLVGSIVVSLTRQPETYVALVQMMRHDFAIYTHAVNVCTYAAGLGGLLGFKGDALVNLAYAGFLLDVGKTKVPRAILDKLTPLTKEEWTIVQHHPEWGAQLLRDAVRNRPGVLEIVLQHHERLDGSGYPRGLKGAEIYPPARIVAVADAYDALTAGRPYQSPLAPYEALMTIREETEQADHFDREVFVAFVKLLSTDRRGDTSDLTAPQ